MRMVIFDCLKEVYTQAEGLIGEGEFLADGSE